MFDVGYQVVSGTGRPSVRSRSNVPPCPEGAATYQPVASPRGPLKTGVNMILERVTLRNFGLYRGEQTFDLTPAPAPGTTACGRSSCSAAPTAPARPRCSTRSRSRSTVPARCSKRTNLAYDEFLRQSIHHGITGAEGAGVSLAFRHASGEEEHVYDVSRCWSVQGKKVREELQVSLDGLHDRWHSDHWGQLVEDFFPLEVSQLFVFDAEKIRSLAEDETSSQVLGTAVKSLLGLDIAERLIADAAVLETRLAARGAEVAKPREDRAGLAQEIEDLRNELDALKTRRSEHENVLLRAKADYERLEAEFQAAGGRHWEKRGDRERRKEDLSREIRESDARLVALAATELPLCLVSDLLDAVARQDERETEAAEAEVIQRLLTERDDQLLTLLAELETAPTVVRKVKTHLARDRESRATARDVDARLFLASGARSMLHNLRGNRLSELRRDAASVMDRRSHLERSFKEVDRDNSITPEDTAIGQFLKRLRAASERVGTLHEEARQLDRTIAERRAEWEHRTAKLRAIQEREAKDEFAQDDRLRMTRIAARTRVVMQEFLTRATERKIDRLSDLITESFRYLLRKQSLVERIQIDPSTFAITLFNQGGHALPRERLSEGEKQIFAISVLWGLARASAHPLPAIIDTPMARLDAAHRRHLVERDFPNASHQVLILSTDTEVDRHYYQALQPHIARAYHLRYDEETQATFAEPGYFWEETSIGTEVRNPA